MWPLLQGGLSEPGYPINSLTSSAALNRDRLGRNVAGILHLQQYVPERPSGIPTGHCPSRNDFRPCSHLRRLSPGPPTVAGGLD